MRRRFIIYPFIFSIYPVLFLYSHNREQLILSIVLRTAGAMAAAIFVFIFLINKLVKDYEKSCLIASLFFIAFFSYSHTFTALPSSWGMRHRYFLVIWSGAFVYTGYLITRSKERLKIFTHVLNSASFFLMFSCSLYFLYENAIPSFFLHDLTKESVLKINNCAAQNIDYTPDIYYIIFDRYAGQDTLKKYYNYDNSDLMNFLSQKGFYIASRSKSNYLNTHYSVASSLNMKYINCTPVKNIDWKHYVLWLMKNNKVFRFAKSRGYKIFYIGPIWMPTVSGANQTFDIYPLKSSFLVLRLYKMTMLRPICKKLHYNFFEDNCRRGRWRRTQYHLNMLKKVTDTKGPKFIFAHLIVPHPPYVFNSNGKFMNYEEETSREERKKYLEQLVYVNKRIKTLVDGLLSNSKKPPIIVIQSDEGPYPPGTYQAFKWSDANRDQLEEKTGILNAYYLPDFDKNILYSSISPVNSFRVIFDYYFGAHYKLLPDEVYSVEQVQGSDYKFVNITSNIFEPALIQ